MHKSASKSWRTCYTFSMRNTAITIALAPIMFLALISTAHAQTSSNLQAELNALLAQLAALQSQLQTTTGSNTGIPTVGGSAYGSCPNIVRTLKTGLSGSDVTALQAFLAADSRIYPEGTISGYFGTLTQYAVQRFQARHGLVTSGTPNTTGYGVVGPATRSLIGNVCRGGTPQPSGGNCVAGGVVVANGSTANFYSTSFVQQGSSCEQYRQTRQCINGVLSGNTAYSYSSCVVGQSNLPGSCTIDGTTFMNGETRSLYRRDVAPFGGQCESGLRTCSNGVLTGSNDYRYTFCSVANAPSTCSLDGKVVAHGSSTTFYTQKNVLFGQNCSAFAGTRACDDGDLEGDRDYRYATCSAAGAKSCTVVATVDGKVATTTVAHGSSKDFWSRESVSYTDSCNTYKLTRTCNDGVLTGSAANKFPACEIIPEKTCTIDGITVAGSATRTFYTARTNANCSNIDQARKCNNGVLSGIATYQYAYCAPTGQRYCVLDEVYVAHNASRDFFSTENTVFGSSCDQFDQSRKCTDGTLNGSASYAYATCKNATGASCTVDGKTITHGSSAKFYSTRTAPSGENCGMYEQNRTCADGNLSGSTNFKYKECSASTADIGSPSQVAAALAAMEALLKDALAKLSSWF